MSRAPDEIPVTVGSGNVFTDLGFPNPEEELAKAQLASHIRQVIKRRRLTGAAAAKLMASTGRRFPPCSMDVSASSPASDSRSCSRHWGRT
jgi:hypothetical protein